MTGTQKTMVWNYKDKLNCSRSEAIREKVMEKYATIEQNLRKFVPLLRFKVTDGKSFDKTAVVTVWKPTEEIFSIIKEGTFYDLSGSTTRGMYLNELQVYAGREAFFEKVNTTTEVPLSLHRRHISISEIVSIDELALNELDTTGIVVHVGETLQKFQPVYIADSARNIVCINFFESVKKFAYEDVVQVKRFLAIKNLQWRKSSNSKPIPCTYVTDYSIFTENPQSSELSSALTNLKMKFANVDVDTFIETCMEMVLAHNSSFQSSMSSLQTSTSLLQKTPSDIALRSDRSSLTVQSRIDQLSKYGEAMSTPPLHINCLKKSFSLPVSKS